MISYINVSDQKASYYTCTREGCNGIKSCFNQLFKELMHSLRSLLGGIKFDSFVVNYLTFSYSFSIK